MKKGKKCDLGVFECGMIVGARFSCTILARVYKAWCKKTKKKKPHPNKAKKVWVDANSNNRTLSSVTSLKRTHYTSTLELDALQQQRTSSGSRRLQETVGRSRKRDLYLSASRFGEPLPTVAWNSFSWGRVSFCSQNNLSSSWCVLPKVLDTFLCELCFMLMRFHHIIAADLPCCSALLEYGFGTLQECPLVSSL